MHHPRQDSRYHGLCYTSFGALAGTRNSSMDPPHEGSIRWHIAPWANALTTELHLAPQASAVHNVVVNASHVLIAHIVQQTIFFKGITIVYSTSVSTIMWGCFWCWVCFGLLVGCFFLGGGNLQIVFFFFLHESIFSYAYVMITWISNWLQITNHTLTTTSHSSTSIRPKAVTYCETRGERPFRRGLLGRPPSAGCSPRRSPPQCWLLARSGGWPGQRDLRRLPRLAEIQNCQPACSPKQTTFSF